MADLESVAQTETVTFESVDDVLHHIQMNLKAPKNQFNAFGKYKYRNCEDIFEGLKEVMIPHAHVTVTDEMVIVGDRYYVKATATLNWGGQTISNVSYAREPQDKKGMDESQVTGATSSYARKYALNGLFMIDDVKDADAGEQEKKEVKKPKEIPLVKEFTQEELEMLLESIEKSPAMVDLDFCKSNGRAAWKRMSETQRISVTKAIDVREVLLLAETKAVEDENA